MLHIIVMDVSEAYQLWKYHTPWNTVVFPTSSPFIKFAIRPKNIPIGDTHAIMSNKKRNDIFFLMKINMFQ